MDHIDRIIAYEQGELDAPGTVLLFSELVKSGAAWSLQGHYGRNARALIERGVLDRAGNVQPFCRHCGQALRDAREESGATGPDYATADGDFGCDESPETNDDGVGSHELLAPVA